MALRLLKTKREAVTVNLHQSTVRAPARTKEAAVPASGMVGYTARVLYYPVHPWVHRARMTGLGVILHGRAAAPGCVQPGSEALGSNLPVESGQQGYGRSPAIFLLVFDSPDS